MLLVGASALALCLLAPVPFVRVYAAFFLVLVLPGLIIGKAALARNWLDAVPLAFCISIGLLLPVMVLAYAVPLSFDWVKYLYAGAVIIGVIIWGRGRLPHIGVPPNWVWLGLIVVLWMFAAHIYGGRQESPSVDSTAIAIILRKLVEMPTVAVIDFPLDRYDAGVTALSYQVWFIAVALVANIAQVDVIDAWVNLPTVVVPLAFGAFFTFVNRVFDDRRVALVAVTIMFWLFVVFRPFQTQVLPFHSIIFNVPMWLALAWSFDALRDGKEGARRKMFVAAGLGALAVMMYLGALMHISVLLGAFAVWLGIVNRDWRSFRIVSGVVLLIALFIIPYFVAVIQFYVADHKTVGEVRPHAEHFLPVLGMRMVDPEGVAWGLKWFRSYKLTALFIVISSVPFIWIYCRHKLYGAYFLSLTSIVFGSMFIPPLTEVLLFFIPPGKIVKSFSGIAADAGIPLTAFWVVSAFDALRSRRYWRRLKWAGLVTLGVVGTWASWAHLESLSARYFDTNFANTLKSHVLERKLVRDGFLKSPPAFFWEISEHVHSGATVASASLRIGAFANVFMPRTDNGKELVQLFSPATGRVEALEIVEALGADYLLEYVPLSNLPDAILYRELGLELELVHDQVKFARWPEHFHLLASSDGWHLYKVNPKVKVSDYIGSEDDL